ncbi:hypothetical protein PENDEC_c031G00661 [Penicillium decumbens]|uniref:Uncharacterized protein n=1 Tax=Penicillium decumbens TaxID=69771 RepID=A0A1V6NVK3_PENDC|nr:hypothetical protein PENDEC_c031G00661 [Penicillium decumbens]
MPWRSAKVRQSGVHIEVSDYQTRQLEIKCNDARSANNATPNYNTESHPAITIEKGGKTVGDPTAALPYYDNIHFDDQGRFVRPPAGVRLSDRVAFYVARSMGQKLRGLYYPQDFNKSGNFLEKRVPRGLPVVADIDGTQQCLVYGSYYALLGDMAATKPWLVAKKPASNEVDHNFACGQYNDTSTIFNSDNSYQVDVDADADSDLESDDSDLPAKVIPAKRKARDGLAKMMLEENPDIDNVLNGIYSLADQRATILELRENLNSEAARAFINEYRELRSTEREFSNGRRAISKQVTDIPNDRHRSFLIEIWNDVDIGQLDATGTPINRATHHNNTHATAGTDGQATAGNNTHADGQATAGTDGQATAGNDGQATAGNNTHADGQATAGTDGQATAGNDGQATAGNETSAVPPANNAPGLQPGRRPVRRLSN